ncbi:DNA integrity scanning diadenylate cyclase DisA [Brevibacterium daeguense]|uniref:DNA integrity scanning protein DisA n=1 Tax=Brevibacterium daeguense TaxID=909936 RepID=A0ABP8EL72_9MICO
MRSPSNLHSLDPQAAANRASSELLLSTLAAAAPGTELRDGLERILRGRTGALIVLGSSRTVNSISTGGFSIEIEFSATRLRELAKMDGAIVLDRDARRIHSAGVQLLPNPAIETTESGTRHRTAERVAKQTGFPVISVSQSMQIIQLYVHNIRHVLEASDRILSHANQALDTLERYKSRLDEVTATLTYLEVVDRATMADVLVVLQRQEMVRRISAEISTYILELGQDGRLVTLQHEELMGSYGNAQLNLLRDYIDAIPEHAEIDDVLRNLALLSGTELIDIDLVARSIGTSASSEALDRHVYPLGYRVLSSIRRVPSLVVERLATHFGRFSELLAADIDELVSIEGVGQHRARIVREGLNRIVEEATEN